MLMGKAINKYVTNPNSSLKSKKDITLLKKPYKFPLASQKLALILHSYKELSSNIKVLPNC